ncbi:hypothetical protein MHL30_16885 [Priestia flexa]|uniref:hypothetical protein n=1 Tax=Priestia flexa TaxID=86664 RepID=UPI001EF4289B|nr:hypothetical protein [Priestia flexa]MCG7314798.1 hypothetical protein [Priestia flexa]
MSLNEEHLGHYEIKNGKIYYETRLDLKKMSIKGQNKKSIELLLNPPGYDVDGDWII